MMSDERRRRTSVPSFDAAKDRRVESFCARSHREMIIDRSSSKDTSSRETNIIIKIIKPRVAVIIIILRQWNYRLLDTDAVLIR